MNDGPYSVYGASGVVGSMAEFQNADPYVAVVKDGAGVGRVYACEGKTSVLGTMQALIPNELVERDFLFHLIKSLKLGSESSGSTIPHIYFKDYGKRMVSLPDPIVQRNIAGQLNSIEDQIGQTQKQIESLDSLVKSKFVEMFGDGSFEKVPFGDCVKVMHIGPFGSALKNDCFVPEELASCVVYEQKHAIKKTIDQEFRFVGEKKHAELARFEAGPGTVLVSCRGTVGEVYCLPPDAPVGIIHPSLMKIEIDRSKFNETYFVAMLKHILETKARKAVGSGVKMAIKAKELAKVIVESPPLHIQDEYESFAHQVDKSKSVAQKQIEKLQLLYDSLAQEYFGD